MTLQTQLVVKDDRSLEVLLPQEMAVVRDQKMKKRLATIKMALLLSVLLAVAILTFSMLWDIRNSRFHRIHFMLNGQRTEDSIFFNQRDDTMVMRCGVDDSMTITDLETGYNAYKLQLPGFNDNEMTCFVTDRVGYDRHDIRDSLLNSDKIEQDLEELEKNDSIVAQLDERQWEPQTVPLVDLSFLPRKIAKKCKDLPVYWIEPTRKRYTRGIVNEEDSEEAPTYDPPLRRLVYNPPSVPPLARQLLPPNLRVDPGESDHGKDCCALCTRPEVYCRNVCIPLRTTVYPYYYKNCRHLSCSAILPCSYWYALVTGRQQPAGRVQPGQ